MFEALRDESNLWQSFQQQGCLTARDQLVSHYKPWASRLANGIYHRVRAYSVDREDFSQNALIGLLEAVDRFDHTRGIPFPAYASRRVRGAVFNGLRTILADRSPPTSRMSYRLSEMDDDDERDPFSLLLGAVSQLGMSYLLDENLGAMGMRSMPDAYDSAYERQTSQRLLLAINVLPEKLRSLIDEHYYKGKKFIDIAQERGLTKGRISQMHKEALTKLRLGLRDVSD